MRWLHLENTANKPRLLTGYGFSITPEEMTSNMRKCFLVIFLGIGSMMVLQILFVLRCRSTCPTIASHHPDIVYLAENCPRPESIDISDIPMNVSNIPRQIFDVAMYLKKAKLHARGSKTRLALRYACDHMDTILKGFGTSFKDVTKRKVSESSSVCPEYYVDNIRGYHVNNCSFSKPIEQLVTVVRLDDGSRGDAPFISDSYGENISVVVGDYSGIVKEKNNNTNVIHMAPSITEGDALNMLTTQVKTEYTLIARNVKEINYDSRIERLVREIERLNVSAVGGSIRNSDNIWSLGCHQRVFQNYTVVYQEGYDESLHDCVFCDHLDGPFLIRTDELKRINFDSNLTPMGLYEDFFMRLNSEVAVCPDALFDMNFPRRSEVTTEWEKFGRKRNLYKLKFSSELIITFPCNYDYPCTIEKGYVRSPCCLQELADLTNDFMEMCDRAGASCQLNAGTHLGAVKMNKVIPWETDADIKFWCKDFTALKNAGLNLRSKGITVSVEHISNCTPSADPAQLGATSKHWHLDIWSTLLIDSYILRSKNRNATKIPHNGRLVYGLKNPGLASRTRYPEPFRHQLHLNEQSVMNIYNFTQCFKFGNHDCVENYNDDGNIQFSDTLA